MGLRNKVKPEGWQCQTELKRVEERSTAVGPEVCGAERATSDQAGARGTREPGGVIRKMAPGAKGERSQGGAEVE